METHTHILFNFSEQMILRLKNEANTREQDVHCLEENLHVLTEELEQTRADHERCVENFT